MIDVHEIMSQLSHKRPVFHSEADFQHAFAWDLHTAIPQCTIRLELPLEVGGKRLHLDLWASTAGTSVAIELKYKTRALSVEVAGERFLLRDQAAQDLARYDFIKDIERLERITAIRRGAKGYAVFLTNDSAYWKNPGNVRTVDAAYRIHDGRMVRGYLAWSPRASSGTIKGRERPIGLRGEYRIAWHDYSSPAPSTYGSLRYVVVSVG